MLESLIENAVIVMNLDPKYLWMMGFCYLLTIIVETPILLVGLSRHHPIPRRLFCGLWLTACTYPVVWFVLPEILMDYLGWNRTGYILVAETFAPLAECLIFWLAFGGRTSELGARPRDFVAIVLANLASFLAGEIMYSMLD
jgi:hypothetical protein